MKMKIVLLSAALLLGAPLLRAQTPPEGTAPADSLVWISTTPTVDSTLVGKNIFQLLPSRVRIHQSDALRGAVISRCATAAEKPLSGWRVRIFFDNKQTSRGDSEAALYRFRAAYPEISAYRNFSNSFFRVTVGDFRTKSEAMQLLQRIRSDFPAAFVVRENINYPVR